MSFNTEGIIFRQTRMVQGRRMILLFTKEYGKISVGSNIGDKGRSKSSLALRPFTYGSYQIFEGRNYYELDHADAITSYYAIGEDLDRYAAGSFVLELTEKMIPEGLPQPAVFSLLLEFLQELEQRKRKYMTLVLAYELKLLRILGAFPVMDSCVVCGRKDNLNSFCVEEGGMICDECAGKAASNGQKALIFHAENDIVNVVDYFVRNPLRNFAGIALSDEVADKLQRTIRAYMEYHFDLGRMKSEGLFSVKENVNGKGIE